MHGHPPSRCPRCGADLLPGAAGCPACDARSPTGANPGAEPYRDGKRLLETPAIRAAYLLPFAIPAALITALILSKLAPAQYEDTVGNVLGGLIAFAVLAILGAVLWVSARSASKGGRFHALGYVLPAAGIVLALAAQVTPRALAIVLQVLGSVCLLLAVPAVLLSTALRGQAAGGGAAAAPAKLDVDTLQRAGGALGASLAKGLVTPWRWAAASPPPASFHESPAAHGARIEQLRAVNGMLRAARVNAAPLMAMARLTLVGFPAVMLFVAAVGVLAIARAAWTVGPPPKTSLGEGLAMVVVGVGAAAMFQLFVLAPRAALGRRVARLADHMGSSVVAHHGTAMLDWLAHHWADHPASWGLGAMGWHWIVPCTFRARPVLLSVLDDLGGRGMPRVRRIDVYVSCPCSAPLLDDAAVASVRALGFDAVQSPAGVRLERRDTEPGALDPGVLDALLRAAVR